MKTVTFRQLRVFVEVARHLSFVRAAEALHLTPPAVTMQIKELESAIELPLFNREGRKVSLTTVGEYFLVYAKRLLATLKDADDAMARFRKLESGALSIGLVSTAKYFVPQLLTRFRDEHPGVELKLVTLDGRVAARGEEGEIRTKCRQLFAGYLDSSLDADAFDEDGWFRTGDVGHIRPDGHVVLTGRLKDIIIRKGENISAKEIEDLLYAHPKVADVAVIGLVDRERGERVCAVVERVAGSNDDLTFDEMVAYLGEAGLTKFKTPEQLEVVDALPRNETLRKVLKYKLRETFNDKPWP